MRLADWLFDHQLTATEFAEQLGIQRQSLWRYISGERVPRPSVLKKITSLTGGMVTANDFAEIIDPGKSAAPELPR